MYTACGNKHTHSFSTEWVKDGLYHWQACSGCDEIRNKAEHDWSSGMVTLQPTETSEGTKTYTCTTCGQTKMEVIPTLDVHEHAFSESWSSNETHHWHEAICGHANEKKDYNEHNWNAGEITTPPTESDEGVRTFICLECFKSKTETIPALGDNHVHEYNQQVAGERYLKDAATCTTKAVYYCSCTCGVSGTATFEYGDLADHKYSNTWSYNDTHHWHAATCEHASEKKDQGEHNWDSGVVTTEPTTTSVGVKTFTCQSCGKIKNEDVPKLEEEHSHVYNQQNTNEQYILSVATCTAKAKYYYSCICGLKGTATFEYGSPVQHIFTTYTSDGNATCTKDGTKTAVCDVCHIATDAIADVGSAKGHTYSTEWTNDDTCHWHASTCGHTNEMLGKETHHWDAGEITKQPTETSEGEKTYTCDVCQKTKVDRIGKLNHVHTYDFEYTCDDNYHWYAATCVHASEVKGKAAHRWDAGITISEADVYDEGIKLYTCQDCGHTKEETIAKIASFTVVFHDSYNRIISKNNYELNTTLSQIAIPTIQAEEGLQFKSWINIADSKNISDMDFSKAQENTVYQFKPTFIKLHNVIFVDYKGTQLGETLIVKDGDKITASNLPAIPERAGYRSKWDEQILSAQITETKVLSPVYEVITFTVTFLDAKDGNKIITRTVESGSFAMIPEYDLYRLEDKLYGFTGWKSSATDAFIENVKGNKITDVDSDLTVYAVYEESIEQPVLAVHIDGTTVTMSLCMPDNSSLYSINLSMGWTPEKGMCEIINAMIPVVTPLNKENCGKEKCTVYVEKNEWITYNNKEKTVDFVWNCGNGHSFSISSDTITLAFGVNDQGQVTESMFSVFEGSTIVYGENAGSINDLKESNVTIWFY